MHTSTRRFLAALAVLFVLAPVSVRALTVSDLEQEIQSLLAKISALQAQTQTVQAPVEQTQQTASGSQATICPVFLRTLSQGDSGNDVLALQQYLIAQGFLTAGSATGFFGPLTQSAVQAWQATYGIVSSGTPASTGYGVAGSQTRAAITSRCAATATECPAQPPTPLAEQCVGGTWSKVYDGKGCFIDWSCSGTYTPPAQCSVLIPQPATSSCSVGAWEPVTDANGCTTSWQCGLTSTSTCTAISIACPAGEYDQVGANCSHTCVSGTPDAGVFLATPASGLLPLTVTFTTGSIAGGTMPVIDFGDGSDGSMQTWSCTQTSPTSCTYWLPHTYYSAGSFTATISNASGILGSTAITVTR
jgi:hypothetical protein